MGAAAGIVYAACRLWLYNDHLSGIGGNRFPIFLYCSCSREEVSSRMQIEIKIDKSCKEPKIIVVTDKMTDELSAAIKRLSNEQPQLLAGFREDTVELLEMSDIYRVFAASGKVFAETEHGEYTPRLRLYEAEQRLGGHSFARISNSDIINLKKVRCFDLSFTGTICVTLSNETVTYVSRRYVARIKQLLGI